MTTRLRRYPGLPQPYGDSGSQLKTLTATKEALEMLLRARGNVNDSAVTVGELETLGLVRVLPNGLVTSPLQDRVAALEANVASLAGVLSRTSAYGSLIIDSASTPYTGGPTIVTNWDAALPGPPAGSAALQVTLNTTAGTITPLLAGVYLVSVAVSGTGGTGALYTVDLHRNGTRLIGFVIDQSNQSARWTVSYALDVLAAANDVFDIRLTASASTTVDHATFSATKTGLVQADIPTLLEIQNS